MDPTLEAILVALAKSAPSAIQAIALALSSGESPEQAVARARAALDAVKKIDTAAEDAARRARVRSKAR